MRYVGLFLKIANAWDICVVSFDTGFVYYISLEVFIVGAVFISAVIALLLKPAVPVKLI